MDPCHVGDVRQHVTRGWRSAAGARRAPEFGPLGASLPGWSEIWGRAAAVVGAAKKLGSIEVNFLERQSDPQIVLGVFRGVSLV
jgi:hypothetical protein